MSGHGTREGAEANVRFPSTAGTTLGVAMGSTKRSEKQRVADQLKARVAELPAILQHFGAAVALKAGPVHVEEAGKTIHSMTVFTEAIMAIDQATSELAIVVFHELETKDRQELARIVLDRLRKPASLEQVAVKGRSAMQTIIAQLVEQELDVQRPMLVARIEKLVAERWEKEVEDVVRKRVDAAIAKVKAEVAR